jgi:hypothetical protein
MLTWVVNNTATASDSVEFARDIRPILADACFKCHGPDAESREADLRLDTAAGLADLDRKEFLRRILSVDPDERMPPPAANKVVTPEQQQILKRWLEQGAHWQEHWAFVPPRSPQIPEVQRPAWCRNEIDRFVLQRLEQAQLVPGADAPPHTLLRRLYLDLIGLLPTPAEADYWLARVWPGLDISSTESSTDSASPEATTPAMDEVAYQALVTSLLSSPHYGERWGRRWLDLARYADTNGYEKDRDRSVWPYRDWVVDAFNRDLPFDQFTIEQIAGDMLPGATEDQRIATGFHRNTMLNEEGGIDPLEYRFHALTDRVATTGTTWLGITLGCCQCHTHKYDPITHVEYYQFMALLNNADELALELPRLFQAGDVQRVWEENRHRAEQLLTQLPQQWPVSEKQPQTFDQAYAAWLAEQRAQVVPWTHLRPLQATSNLPILTIEADDSIFASGDTAKRDVYEITVAAHTEPITAIRLEALPDSRLPARGPGTTYYEGTLGDFYLVEMTASHQGTAVDFSHASETYAKNRYGKNPVGAQFTIDGDVQTGWSVDGRQGERHVAVYQLREPLPAGSELTFTLTFGRHFASSLGRFRFSATSSERPARAVPFEAELEQLLGMPPSALTDEQNRKLQAELRKQFALTAPQLDKPAEEIRKLLAQPEVPTSLIFAERPAEHPRPTFRHHRGEYLQPAEQVQPGVPAIWPGLPADAARNRLSLARWLVSDDHPLTSRVTVNRLWSTLLGTGIVATEQDFGLQGAAPSHPELLDWLALQFMHADGWSQKRLLRRIVSSRTYRQSSQVNAAAASIDPGNRLLSYAPRFRLEAESLRDSLLVASGQLSRQLGGPPVRPLQSTGITEVAYGSPTWQADNGPDRYRRSLYTYMKRTAPFAMSATFDAPSGEACIANRSRSNSPLQALTLLNDVMVVDIARAAGKRHAAATANPIASVEAKDSSQHREQLQQLFRSVLVRPATPEELNLLADFWQTQYQTFAAHPEQAQLLVSETQGQPAPTAAWIATARALFALDETQTRE